MSRWTAVWASVTKNRRATVLACLLVALLAIIAERVMDHRYRLDIIVSGWHLNLAPVQP